MALGDVYDEALGGLVDVTRVRQLVSAAIGQIRDPSRILFMLGPYMFSSTISAPRSVDRSTRFEWQKQSRIGRESALQFTGQGDDTITIEGRIYPHYKGGLNQVSAMREMARAGIPWPLIDGRGNVYGKFVITSVTENKTHFLKDSSPRRIDFKLTLEKYGDDNNVKRGFLPF